MNKPERNAMIIVLELLIKFKTNQIKEHEIIVDKLTENVTNGSMPFIVMSGKIMDNIKYFQSEIDVTKERIKKLHNDNLDFSKVKLVEDLDNL